MGRELEESVRAGIAWLARMQEESGEFASFSSSLLEEPQWEPDRLNFVTALTSLALEGVVATEVDEMRMKVAEYLVDQREPGGLWRYWSRTSPLHDYTPLDVDDTACCSMAVGPVARRSNVSLLLANRDPQGRFYTWMLLRPQLRDPRLRWRLRSERSGATRSRREELWNNSEASPDDVDATVNANVIRYLGPGRAPAAAIDWVASVVESGTEVEQDHWYRSRMSLYRSVAAAGATGVRRFAELRDVMIRRIVEDPGPGGLRNDLEAADALKVLRTLEAHPADIDELARYILGRQRAEGCWERAICYYGGPQQSFGWASEALTTATAVGALHGLDMQRLRHS